MTSEKAKEVPKTVGSVTHLENEIKFYSKIWSKKKNVISVIDFFFPVNLPI